MRSYSNITIEVKKKTTGLLNGTNEGFELVYHKDQLEGGELEKDADVLKSLGYEFTVKGRKWRTLQVKVQPVRKHGFIVWYA